MRDSLALMAIYDALVTNTGLLSDWPNLPIASWTEIGIQNERVTTIGLASRGLAGEVPDDIVDIGGLVFVDFSGNEITGIPDVTSLSAVTTFDVSGNKLDFGSLEPNATVPGMNYQNQDSIGVFTYIEIPLGDNRLMDIVTGGTELNYQWNHITPTTSGPIGGATSSFYEIENIVYETMGDHYVEVTSDIATNLILTGRIQRVLAYGNIEFFPIL